MARNFTLVPTKGSVLKWARQYRGLTLEQAAGALGINTTELVAIEENDIPLSPSLFSMMETVYRQTESVLLLPSPPETQPLPTDYRTVGGAEPLPSLDTFWAIREAQQIQAYVSELLEENRELMPYANIPEASLKESPETFAIAERRKFRVDIQTQFSWTPGDDSFKQWRFRTEASGILVLTKKMPWSDCRGLSLMGEKLVPTIVVNSQDIPQARIFSLFHEYAHLMLQEGGLCLRAEDTSQKGRTEHWCNQFAAAFLMPGSEVRQYIVQTFLVEGRREWTIQEIRRLATKFRVSRPAMALRLQTLELAPPDYYDRHKAELEPYDKKPEPPEREEPLKIKKPPGWRAKQKLQEVGLATTSVLLTAWEGGMAAATDIADTLNLSLDELALLNQYRVAERSRIR